MKIDKQLKRLGLLSQNIRKRLPGHRPGIFYVVPKAGWSIDWDGHYITKGVREQFGATAELTDQPRWLSGQSIAPGETPLTRTAGARSFASDRVNIASAAFAGP